MPTTNRFLSTQWVWVPLALLYGAYFHAWSPQASLAAIWPRALELLGLACGIALIFTALPVLAFGGSGPYLTWLARLFPLALLATSCCLMLIYA